MNALHELAINSWQPAPDAAAVEALEQGKILYLPHLPFELDGFEKRYVDTNSMFKLDSKSVKFSPKDKTLWGVPDKDKLPQLAEMLERYSSNARTLVQSLLSQYTPSLLIGNTSFRPAKIEGREQSKRHDDRRLHVDAFPSRPNHGQRILRVFTNVHPGSHPRTWRVGEPFADVAAQFMPKISAPLPGSAKVLRKLKITKALRTPYDHYMLKIHDKMKLDDKYQQDAPQQTVQFPPGATWIVFSDQVSHAAMAGQFVFEQTFTLPFEAMARPEQSPLKILEKLKQKQLI